MASLSAVIRTIGILAASNLLLPVRLARRNPTLELEAAWIQLSDENIECAAFYSIVGRCRMKVRQMTKAFPNGQRRPYGTMLDRAVKFTAQAKMKSEKLMRANNSAINRWG